MWSACFGYSNIWWCKRVACGECCFVLASRSGADCNGGLETNFQRARAHQIWSAPQLIRLWQVDPCKFSMPIRRCLPCSSVRMHNCCSGKTPGY
eukprot:1337905-Pleurochrysis_carterae.AAC.1